MKNCQFITVLTKETLKFSLKIVTNLDTDDTVELCNLFLESRSGVLEKNKSKTECNGPGQVRGG